MLLKGLKKGVFLPTFFYRARTSASLWPGFFHGFSLAPYLAALVQKMGREGDNVDPTSSL